MNAHHTLQSHPPEPLCGVASCCCCRCFSPLTHPPTHTHTPTFPPLPAGEDAIRHLFSRGTHREFGYAALLVMLAFYFAGAAWTAGSAISSGVFVPMLLIGACIGRLVGLGVVDMAARAGGGSDG